MVGFFKIVNPRPGNEFLNREHFAKSHNGTQALKKNSRQSFQAPKDILNGMWKT